MSTYMQTGYSIQSISFPRNSRRNQRINRKYRKAALQAEIEAQACRCESWAQA